MVRSHINFEKQKGAILDLEKNIVCLANGFVYITLVISFLTRGSKGMNAKLGHCGIYLMSIHSLITTTKKVVHLLEAGQHLIRYHSSAYSQYKFT